MGKLTVKIISAHNLEAKDATGTSDPYVELAIGGEKHKTKTVKKSLNPRYNETFTFHRASSNDTLSICMYDWDRFSKNDLMGTIQIPLRDLIQGREVDKLYPLAGARSGELYVALKAEDFGLPQQQAQPRSLPPQQPYYPPQQPYYPPQQPYPSQGYPPQQPYPSQGYPPQQPYPSQGYPPQQPYPSQGFPQSGLAPGSYAPPQNGLAPPQQQQQSQYRPPPSSNRGGVRKPPGMSDQEFQHCQVQFRQVDLNGNGTIDKDELKRLLRATIASKMTEMNLNRFVEGQFASADSDKSGSIDFNEFLVVYMKLKENRF